MALAAGEGSGSAVPTRMDVTLISPEYSTMLRSLRVGLAALLAVLFLLTGRPAAAEAVLAAEQSAQWGFAPGIKTLDLSGRGITSIAPDAFAAYGTLES